MTITDNARRYDWETWMLGIMRSFLSGGAVALCTGGGCALLDIPGTKIWKLMALNFILMGLYRMGEFLQLHGAPDQLQASLQKASDAADSAENDVRRAKAAVAQAKAIAPQATKTDE